MEGVYSPMPFSIEKKVMDKGKQKVDLHTMLPLLHESDTLLHECDTLERGCDTSLHECNNFWNYSVKTLIGIFLDIQEVL